MAEPEQHLEPTEQDRAEWARELHARKPAKFAQCPDCNLFSAAPWRDLHQTQDGNIYTWGGICKTHGAWSEST